MRGENLRKAMYGDLRQEHVQVEKSDTTGDRETAKKHTHSDRWEVKGTNI